MPRRWVAARGHGAPRRRCWAVGSDLRGTLNVPPALGILPPADNGHRGGLYIAHLAAYTQYHYHNITIMHNHYAAAII